jgi:hypothetical protein
MRATLGWTAVVVIAGVVVGCSGSPTDSPHLRLLPLGKS